MSKIKLPHASGNSVSIAAPQANPASDRTLYLPSNADGTVLTNTTPGCVLQVLQAVKTDTGSIGSSTYALISNLSKEITTTGSNKVLIGFTVTIGSNSGNQLDLRIGRVTSGTTSTDLFIGDANSTQKRATVGGYANSETWQSMSYNSMFLDSPGAGTHTYGIYWASHSGTQYINRSYDDGSDDRTRQTSQITLMEVAV